jgi:hypothetical protein
MAVRRITSRVRQSSRLSRFCISSIPWQDKRALDPLPGGGLEAVCGLKERHYFSSTNDVLGPAFRSPGRTMLASGQGFRNDSNGQRNLGDFPLFSTSYVERFLSGRANAPARASGMPAGAPSCTPLKFSPSRVGSVAAPAAQRYETVRRFTWLTKR